MSLKIGELAKRAGISVRTLHHYDEVGLLCPSGRTNSDHRLYNLENIQKLQHILMLKKLGFSLEDIKQYFNSPVSLVSLLESVLTQAQQALEQKAQQIVQLEKIIDRFQTQDVQDVDDLMVTIEVITMIEKYYTKAQLDQLKARYEKIDPKELEQAATDWKMIFDGFTKAQQEGKPVSSPEVVALAQKAISLVQAFTGGDQGIEKSLKTMYKQEGGDKVLRKGGMDVSPEVFGYYQQAMDYAKSL